jgi:CubicO group peptidase (beta-lactamase class C family)
MRPKESRKNFIQDKSIPLFWMAFFFVFFFCSPGFAAAPMNGEALPGLESFDKATMKFIEKYDIPGGSLAVSFKGRLILAKGYGYADFSVFKKVPVHSKNRFRFASLSKPLTATAIMSLVEEGKLSLDSKVAPLLQGDPPHAIKDNRLEQITIQHLLEHRGGYDTNIESDPMFAAQPPCPGNLSSYFRERLDFAPGEKFAYSNLGYCLLGRVIERVSGKPYEAFIRERILKPVGANSLEIGESKETKPDEVLYFQEPLQSKVSPYVPYGSFDMKALDSCGGWIGSAVDYLKFLTSLDGQRAPALLKPETVKIMLAMPDDPVIQDRRTYYAKGFHVRKKSNGRIEDFWHAGSLPGTLTLAVRASNGYGWVVFFNRSSVDWERLRLEIDRGLFQASREIKEVPPGNLFGKF